MFDQRFNPPKSYFERWRSDCGMGRHHLGLDRTRLRRMWYRHGEIILVECVHCQTWAQHEVQLRDLLLDAESRLR